MVRWFFLLLMFAVAYVLVLFIFGHKECSDLQNENLHSVQTPTNLFFY